MKNLITFTLIVALLFTPIILCSFLIAEQNEFEDEIKNSLLCREKKIEELEKEIRFLKTDIYIIQHGYEGENME